MSDRLKEYNEVATYNQEQLLMFGESAKLKEMNSGYIPYQDVLDKLNIQKK